MSFRSTEPTNSLLYIRYDEILKVLSGKLTPDLFPKALKMAHFIGDESSRTKALIALAENSPTTLQKAVSQDQIKVMQIQGLTLKDLELVQDLQNEFKRGEALIKVVDKLTPDLLPKALEIVKTVDIVWLPKILTSLVDKLTPDLLSKYLEVCHLLGGYEYINLIAILANYFPEFLAEIVDAAQEIPNHLFLGEIVFPLIQAPNCISLWKSLLHSCSQESRPNLLRNLTILAPVIITLSHEADTAETAQAIEDVCRWWP